MVAPDDHVTARIKKLKKQIPGSKREDNEWTKVLRAKLDQETVQTRLAGDRTFKTNQQWFAPASAVTKGETPKWSWFGVLFLLAPFGILSDKKQFPTVWVCACTKGFQLCGCVHAPKVRSSLNPHPSSVVDGVGGQNPPSVIRSVRYRKMT